jgi:hypothetical protein
VTRRLDTGFAVESGSLAVLAAIQSLVLSEDGGLEGKDA